MTPNEQECSFSFLVEMIDWQELSSFCTPKVIIIPPIVPIKLRKEVDTFFQQGG